MFLYEGGSNITCLFRVRTELKKRSDKRTLTNIALKEQNILIFVVNLQLIACYSRCLYGIICDYFRSSYVKVKKIGVCPPDGVISK